MSNDWSIVPAAAIEFNGATARDNDTHAVFWTFPSKQEAAAFAVKAEYINEHNIDLAAASIFLDSLKVLGTDSPTRVALAAVGENVKTQLKLNRAMALLEQSCGGDLNLIHKVRAVVEKT